MLGFSTIIQRQVSSAKRQMFDWMLFTISLIKISKSGGLRIEPCGTPTKIKAQSYIIPFITTLCLHPDR